MLLVTPARTSLFQSIVTGPTVVAPGDPADLKVRVTALAACELAELAWQTPAGLAANIRPLGSPFPVRLAPSQEIAIETTIGTQRGAETFGEIHLTLRARPIVGTVTNDLKADVELWLSVFERASADDRAPLSDPLRERLVNVVNSRARNGHIFLADYVRFFDDFLNIAVPDSAAVQIGQSVGLPAEGLPLDPETRQQIVLGVKAFYGIERLLLLRQDECVDADGFFDSSQAAEVR
jgi:hypothetical protein